MKANLLLKSAQNCKKLPTNIKNSALPNHILSVQAVLSTVASDKIRNKTPTPRPRECTVFNHVFGRSQIRRDDRRHHPEAQQRRLDVARLHPGRPGPRLRLSRKHGCRMTSEHAHARTHARTHTNAYKNAHAIARNCITVVPPVAI